MRVDIASRLAPGVLRFEPVHGPRRPPPRPLGAAGLAERNAVGGEQREQRHRVGAGPFAGVPRLIPADRAGGSPAGASARQSLRSISADESRARPPSLRCVPSGSRARIVPVTRPASTRSISLWKPGREQPREDARGHAETLPARQQRVAAMCAPSPPCMRIMEDPGTSLQAAPAERSRACRGCPVMVAPR